MQRRTLLGLGAAGTALLALGGAGAALIVEAAWRDGQLLSAGRRVMTAVARAVLEGSLPNDPARQATAIEAHLGRLQAAVAAMPPHIQSELNQLLTLLATAPGRIALAGLSSAWATASIADLQQALQSMRVSSLLLRRQAFSALRDLTHAAYFADASTWPQLGYPGPRALA